MSYFYETELDLCGRFHATVEIEYTVVLGEKTVHYYWDGYRDGSGYPGSPPSIEVIKVTVTSLSGAIWDKNRDELVESGWAERIDNAAWNEVEKLLDNQEWLFDHLIENTEPCYE